MAIVVLKLATVKRKREDRPRQCRYCEGQIFQRWGQVNKKIKDVHIQKVKVYRYKCCGCKRTFRYYPEGSTKADQSERLRLFSVLMWSLGMSYRSASWLLGGLGVVLSFMSIWRNAQEEAEKIKKRNLWKPVRVVGVDGAAVLGWGKKQGVLVAVDLGTGQPLALGYVNEYDPQAVCRWLKPLVQRHQILTIVTDDLASYKIVTQKLELGHQVCQFHVRRWVGKTLKELQETVPKEWLWVLDKVHELLQVLPPNASQTLFALWKQLPGRLSLPAQSRLPIEKLRDLLLRMSEHWSAYSTFQSQHNVPWTNNATERAIGRMKMRARTVRGYKSWNGMQNALLLAGHYSP